LNPAHTKYKEEIIDRLSDHPHRDLTKQDSQGQSQTGTQDADQRSFTQHHAKDLLAGISNASQRAKERPSLHDGKSHSVIDEEDSY
jgi:hypothetical protein